MSDFDFDKSFADDLQKERFFEPLDENWTRVSAALDRRDRAQKLLRRAVRFGLPSLLAALAIAFFAEKSIRAERRAEALETRIEQIERSVFLKNEAGKSFGERVKNGPNPAEKVVGEDANNGLKKAAPEAVKTAEKTSLAQPPISIGGAEKPKAAHENGFSHLPKPSKQLAAEPSAGSDRRLKTAAASGGFFGAKTDRASSQIPAEKALGEGTKNGDGSSEKSGFLNSSFDAQIEGQKPFASSFSKSADLPFLPFLNLKSLAFDRKSVNFSDFLFEPRAVARAIRPARDHRFLVGLTGGFAEPLGQKVEFGEGNSSGLALQFLAKKAWRLTAGAAFEQTFFDQKEIDPSDLPTPKSPDDEFEKVDLRRSELAFSAGLRRDFWANRRLHPFATAAWVGARHLQTESDFQFQKASGGNYKVSGPADEEPRFSSKNARVGLGGAFRITPRLEMSAETGWRQRFDTDKKDATTGQISATAGLFYRF